MSYLNSNLTYTCHRPRRRCLALLLLAGLGLLLAPPRASADDSGYSFPETGQFVGGAFWAYWLQHGGLAVQGYPISPPLQETSPLDGRTYTVQYFERAVFEAHPENSPPYDVLLAQLGTFRYREKYSQGAPGQQPAPGGQPFPQTGHVVGGAFLAYWQTHGGLAQFGYPLSDAFTETSDLDGKPYTVQYFERAIFEAHPENAPPYDVLLAQLGTFRLRAQYPAGPPTPIPPPVATPPPIPTLPGGAPPPLGAGGDWPMYGHDPARSNANPAEQLINAGNVSRLVPLWQVHLPGSGTPVAAGPVVAGGRVYVASSAPQGPNFFALDAVTGAPLWADDLGYFASTCDDVGIGATPAISGTVLVAGGGNNDYFGLDTASGAIMWHYPLDSGPGGFAWESPLLANGRAYLGVASRCDSPSQRGVLRAVDLQTGALVAAQGFVPADRRGAGVWNSPALSPDGRTLVVATGEDFDGYDGPYNRALVALDPLTLAIRQAAKQGAPNVDGDWGTTPIIYPDSQGRTLVGAVHKNGTFYAYDLAHMDAAPVWQQATGVAVGMMPAIADNTLYVAGNHGWIYMFDPATGAPRHDPLAVGKMHGNMAIANGLLFANTGLTGVQVFTAPGGDKVATLLPPNAGASYTGVVVAHGMVYWLSGEYLNAWGLPAAP